MGELRATLGQDEYVLWSRYHALRNQQEQLDNMVAESRMRRG